ncbi:MAG TPA: SRPBCC family protein [bacterium]|nr:SRPBCC family protein [bacterium]
MAVVSRSIAVHAPVERIFDIVSSFDLYPKFLPEIERADVLSQSPKKARVAFTANIVKRIDYTMDFDILRPREIRWTMVDGDMLIKSNDGFWKFEPLEKNLTDLTFSCEMHFNIWLPKSIAEGVISSHLPVMMKNFKAQAEQTKPGDKGKKPQRTKAGSLVARKKRARARSGKK